MEDMSLLASQNYKVGDLIYEGEPFIRVIRHDLWDKICANCLKSDRHLKMCGACGVMKYCEKLCQKKAWKNHKWECPYLRNYKDRRQQEIVQMIGNIVLKINGRDWKTVTERILDTEVSLDELVSHADSAADFSTVANLLSITAPLSSYIGEKNMPDDEALLELLGKVMHNKFEFTLNGDSNLQVYDGSCLFIGASKFERSCVPNSAVKINGMSIALRAIKPIPKSEKISISYCSMVEKVKSFVMYKKMKRTFRKNCNCSDCSQPYGESPLTKIIDMPKASSVLKSTINALELMAVAVRTTTFPIEWGFLETLKQLIQVQEGVLGRTNIYRMRTLAWLCLIMNRPEKEKRVELKQLVDAMVEVWGEYYPELLRVYMELIKVNLHLHQESEALMYAKKVSQLKTVCFGVECDDGNIYAKVLCDTLNRFAK